MYLLEIDEPLKGGDMNYFSLPNLDRVVLVNFLEIFSRCFHCVISAQKEHPESGIRCTSACGRFRVCLHFTSPGDCLQRWLPLVSYLRHLKS